MLHELPHDVLGLVLKGVRRVDLYSVRLACHVLRDACDEALAVPGRQDLLDAPCTCQVRRGREATVADEDVWCAGHAECCLRTSSRPLPHARTREAMELCGQEALCTVLASGRAPRVDKRTERSYVEFILASAPAAIWGDAEAILDLVASGLASGHRWITECLPPPYPLPPSGMAAMALSSSDPRIFEFVPGLEDEIRGICNPNAAFVVALSACGCMDNLLRVLALLKEVRLKPCIVSTREIPRNNCDLRIECLQALDSACGPEAPRSKIAAAFFAAAVRCEETMLWVLSTYHNYLPRGVPSKILLEHLQEVPGLRLLEAVIDREGSEFDWRLVAWLPYLQALPRGVDPGRMVPLAKKRDSARILHLLDPEVIDKMSLRQLLMAGNFRLARMLCERRLKKDPGFRVPRGLELQDAGRLERARGDSCALLDQRARLWLMFESAAREGARPPPSHPVPTVRMINEVGTKVRPMHVVFGRPVTEASDIFIWKGWCMVVYHLPDCKQVVLVPDSGEMHGFTFTLGVGDGDIASTLASFKDKSFSKKLVEVNGEVWFVVGRRTKQKLWTVIKTCIPTRRAPAELAEHTWRIYAIKYAEYLSRKTPKPPGFLTSMIRAHVAQAAQAHAADSDDDDSSSSDGMPDLGD